MSPIRSVVIAFAPLLATSALACAGPPGDDQETSGEDALSGGTIIEGPTFAALGVLVHPQTNHACNAVLVRDDRLPQYDGRLILASYHCMTLAGPGAGGNRTFVLRNGVSEERLELEEGGSLKPELGRHSYGVLKTKAPVRPLRIREGELEKGTKAIVVARQRYGSLLGTRTMGVPFEVLADIGTHAQRPLAIHEVFASATSEDAMITNDDVAAPVLVSNGTELEVVGTMLAATASPRKFFVTETTTAVMQELRGSLALRCGAIPAGGSCYGSDMISCDDLGFVRRQSCSSLGLGCRVEDGAAVCR